MSKTIKTSKTAAFNKTNESMIKFIKHVATNNYKNANAALASVVNEKIAQRIAQANKSLEQSKK